MYDTLFQPQLSNDLLLASTTIKRHFLWPPSSVCRLPLDEGTTVGTLFLPVNSEEGGSSASTLPLIVIAYGGILPGRRVIEEKAAVFASHGNVCKV